MHFCLAFLLFSAVNTVILFVLRFLGIMPIPLDIALSKQPLTPEQLHHLCYRYPGSLFPPMP